MRCLTWSRKKGNDVLNAIPGVQYRYAAGRHTAPKAVALLNVARARERAAASKTDTAHTHTHTLTLATCRPDSAEPDRHATEHYV